MELTAFHGKDSIKAEYVARIKLHATADEIQRGFYWENGKGCAVGCTIHSSDHANYETELGVPRILARLEDRIFEGLSNGVAKEFPRRFLEAIPVGADLSLVWPRFAVWLLVDAKQGVIRHTKPESAQYVSIRRVAELYQRIIDGYDVSKLEFQDARRQSADAAAYAAADAAYAAYAADDAADDAAYAAADAAAAAARSSAYKAARTKSCQAQAGKLIKLLAAAPVRAAIGGEA